MHTDLEARTEELKTWDRPALVKEWEKLWGRQVPRFLSRKILTLSIAYKWREVAGLGLSKETLKKIKKLVAQYRKDSKSLDNIKPVMREGTRVRRVWRGEIYEAEACGDKFRYENRLYGSLSEIAREITGTRWNGQAFFGLRKKKAAKAEVA